MRKKRANAPMHDFDESGASASGGALRAGRNGKLPLPQASVLNAARRRGETPAQTVARRAADEAGALTAKTEAIKDEAIRRGLKKAEGQFWKLALSPPGESNRTDKSRLLAVLGISESEYVARFTSVTHTDWVMRCTARKVPRAAEQEPVVLPPSKRAA
jgi:hypothetical protein